MNDVVNPATYERLAISARDNGLYVVTLNRPEKRNALDVVTIEELIRFFSGARIAGVKAVLLEGAGDHFCAGLDLVEHWKADRSPDDFMHVCLRWHEAFNKMEYGGVPIIAALKGAVVGGGLELASAAHVRVIDPGTYFALPEGQRGIFTGGGATIRVSDMIGKYRMIDMILTGRVYQGQEAVDLGLAQYITEEGGSYAKAMELADKVAQNLPLTNFAHASQDVEGSGRQATPRPIMTLGTEAVMATFIGDALTWGHGPTTLDVFLEPTCGHCGRAFGKLPALLEAAGEDQLTVRIFLQSQPWHLFSPVICRAILAAAATDGGKGAAWDIFEKVFAHREDFIATEHCKGANMQVSPVEILSRIKALTGVDLTEQFELKAVTNEMKRHAKIARQNGVHGSPTFIVNGLINDGMGSRDEIGKWLVDLGLA